MMAKKYVPKEVKVTKAKVFKADQLIAMHKIMHRLEKLLIHMHDLTEEELEEMWPSVAETGFQTGGRKNVHAKALKTDREFLLSLIARQHCTAEAQKFAFEKAQVDLKDQSTKDVIEHMATQAERGHLVA